MSAAAPNGKSTHVVASGSRMPAGASVDKGPAKPGAKGGKSKMTPEQSRQLMVVLVAAVVVLGVGIAIWAYFTRKPIDPEPRLNNETSDKQLVDYVNSNDFDKLPFNRQRLHVKEIASRKKQLEDDFKAGKLSKPEFENVLALAWIGKQFKHMETYYSLGQVDKKNFIDKLIDGDMEPSPKTPGEPKKNKDKVKSVVEKFPQDERRMYDSFQQAVKDRERERVAQDKAAAKAAKAAATRPTTRPAGALAPAGTGAAAPAVAAPK